MPILPAAELRQLAALDAGVLAAIARSDAAGEALEMLEQRHRELTARLKRERATSAPGAEALAGGLARALVDDPRATLDDAALDAGAEDHVRAEIARRATVTALEAAIAELAPQLAVASREAAARTREAEAEWAAFVAAAQAALADELSRRFATLRDEVIAPFVALGEARDLGETRSVSSPTAPRLTRETAFALERFVPATEDTVVDQLMAVPQARADGARMIGGATPDMTLQTVPVKRPGRMAHTDTEHLLDLKAMRALGSAPLERLRAQLRGGAAGRR